MANRKSNSPWGSSYKEGLPSTAVNDTVDIDQNVRATISTGVIDVATGQWEGNRLSDKQFTIDPTHEAVANGATVLSPQKSDHEYIDMTGYNDLFIALNISNAGNYALSAVMGPSTYMYANLTPVDPVVLKGAGDGIRGPADRLDVLFEDGADGLNADVWNIYMIKGNLSNQKLVQFFITNNSGAESSIQFASLRVV